MNTILNSDDFNDLVNKLKNSYNVSNEKIIIDWLLLCPEKVYKYKYNTNIMELDHYTTCGKFGENEIIELYNIINEYISINDLYKSIVYDWLLDFLLNLSESNH